MKKCILILIAVLCVVHAFADGLVQPVYGSPKYSSQITAGGTGNMDGTPRVVWVVEVGEVYIVEGTDPQSHQMIIRMGERRFAVKPDQISLIPPDNADYAKAEKIYAQCVKQADAAEAAQRAAAQEQQRQGNEAVKSAKSPQPVVVVPGF